MFSPDFSNVVARKLRKKQDQVNKDANLGKLKEMTYNLDEVKTFTISNAFDYYNEVIEEKTRCMQSMCDQLENVTKQLKTLELENLNYKNILFDRLELYAK